MRFFTTLPTNNDFFKVYARFATGIKVSTYGAQIVSALTEIGIIYGVLYSILEFFFNDSIATIGASGGALIGTALIEIGLRFFLPHAVDAFLYKRFRGLYLLMSVFIIGMSAALIAASGLLSFRGSKLLVKEVAPEPLVITTYEADSAYNTSRDNVLTTYRTDSTAIANQYNQLISSTKTAAQSEIAIQQNKYDSYKRREQKTGKSFATKKAAVRAKIKDLEAARDAKVNQLIIQQNNELAAIRSDRRAKVDSLTTILTTKTNAVQVANDEAKTDIDETTASYGAGLGWITIIFLAYLIVCIILERVHRKGSGIEEIPVPTDYHFRESIFAEAYNAVSERLNQITRQKITNFAMATNKPPLPVLPHALLNVADFQQAQYNLSQAPPLATDGGALPTDSKEPGSSSTAEPSTISEPPSKTDAFEDAEILENRIYNYLEASVKLEEDNLHEQAKDMQLKAETVIKTYLERNGGEALPEQISDLKAKVIQFVNKSISVNPFAEIRRQIGFKGTFSDGEDTSKNAIYAMRITQEKQGKQKQCLNCGKTYTSRTTWQKYCEEKCRIEHHEKRTGKPVMFKKKK